MPRQQPKWGQYWGQDNKWHPGGWGAKNHRKIGSCARSSLADARSGAIPNMVAGALPHARCGAAGVCALQLMIWRVD